VSAPTPATVFGGPRRERVFDYSAPASHPSAVRAKALMSAEGAAEDVAAAVKALRRDGYERYVDLHIEHLRRATERFDVAMDALLELLDDAPVPALRRGQLPPPLAPTRAATT
jgi:hypothetical protein